MLLVVGNLKQCGQYNTCYSCNFFNAQSNSFLIVSNYIVNVGRFGNLGLHTVVFGKNIGETDISLTKVLENDKICHCYRTL